MARRKNESVPMPSPVMARDDMMYRVREGLRTLNEADEIRKNKPLMREIAKTAKAQLASVTGKKRGR